VEKFINTDGYIPMPTKLKTALCMMSVWKRRVAGKLVFKFEKPLGVAGAAYTLQVMIRKNFPAHM
jgi:hypothetical protein